MKTFNIFPSLEEKFPDNNIQIHINEELDTVYKINSKDGILEVNQLFQLLNPVVQEFIIWQMIYSQESLEPEQEIIDSLFKSDLQSFEKITSEYGEKYEGLLFLAMRILLPDDSLKEERLTNLYYQLSSKNQ